MLTKIIHKYTTHYLIFTWSDISILIIGCSRSSNQCSIQEISVWTSRIVIIPITNCGSTWTTWRAVVRAQRIVASKTNYKTEKLGFIPLFFCSMENILHCNKSCKDSRRLTLLTRLGEGALFPKLRGMREILMLRGGLLVGTTSMGFKSYWLNYWHNLW